MDDARAGVTYDHIHYVAMGDTLSALSGGPQLGYGLAFQSYGTTPMIHRTQYLPSSLSDWDLLGTTYFRFSMRLFHPSSGDTNAIIEWDVGGSSLDSVTFSIVPEPASAVAVFMGLLLLVRPRCRHAYA
jgi:hypothetical protein